MTKILMMLGAIFAGLAVAGGAFASHSLGDQLSERGLEIWETATRYQMYHAFALLFVALILSRLETPSLVLTVAGYAFIGGIVLFSGSLYGLSLSGIKLLGAITPLGGVAFLVGWGCVAIAAWRLKLLP